MLTASLPPSLPPVPAAAQVAVEHLNMLVGLVEEMTCKWERQLENVGEGRWTNDMLAREGTEGKVNQRPPPSSLACSHDRQTVRRERR